jgi:zinc D-Ala-D-Ala carboxypeptidase
MKKLLKFVESLLVKLLMELKFTKSLVSNLDLKYFTLKEFDSPDEVGSGYRMDKDFLRRLDTARGIAGIPFKINSGYRTAHHNDNVIKARIGSSHKKGLAADIGYEGSRERYIILKALMEVGITRYGIAKTFIHCDVDNNKDEDVIWLY